MCRNCHRGASRCSVCHNTTVPKNVPYSAALGGLGRDQLAPANLANPFLNGTLTDQERANITTNTAAGANSELDRSGIMIGNQGQTTFILSKTSTGLDNIIGSKMNLVNKNLHNFGADVVYDNTVSPFNTVSVQNGLSANMGYVKKSRTVVWSANWRNAEGIINSDCSDDGFSWPHRTLGWKMLKDDLFGLNFDGTPVAVGQSRTAQSFALEAGSLSTGGGIGRNHQDTYTTQSAGAAHDIDSVCLDCHNPTVWNATSALNHVDKPSYLDGGNNDNYNEELLTRGLP